MIERRARAAVGYIACLVADASLVTWTLVLWWPPSENKERALHRGFSWAADVCGSATFLGVSIPLVIACAVLLLTRALPPELPGLRVASTAVAGLTVVAVMLPWIANWFSSCAF